MPRMSKFLQNAGLAALAAALAVTALPAAAQEEGHGRWNADRADAGERRADRVRRQGDQRAAQVERRGDAAAGRSGWRGNQAGQAQVQTQQRNPTYADQNRNTTYARGGQTWDGNRRGDNNTQWRDGQRGD